MIVSEPGADWRDLQRLVADILSECGFKTEVAKLVPGARGANEIDVYAVDPSATPEAVYLCECKRWKTHVPQAEVHAFVDIVGNAAAHFGLFISSSGFQPGAHDVVQHTNVHLLDWQGFQQMFVQRWCERFWVPVFRRECDRLASYVDPVVSDAFMRLEKGDPLDPAEALGIMVHEMWGSPFADRRPRPLAPEIWALRDKMKRYLPQSISEANYLMDLLGESLVFAERWAEARDAERAAADGN